MVGYKTLRVFRNWKRFARFCTLYNGVNICLEQQNCMCRRCCWSNAQYTGIIIAWINRCPFSIVTAWICLHICMVYKQIKLLFHKNLFCRCSLFGFACHLLNLYTSFIQKLENRRVYCTRCAVHLYVVVKFTKISTKILHTKSDAITTNRMEIALQV